MRDRFLSSQTVRTNRRFWSNPRQQLPLLFRPRPFSFSSPLRRIASPILRRPRLPRCCLQSRCLPPPFPPEASPRSTWFRSCARKVRSEKNSTNVRWISSPGQIRIYPGELFYEGMRDTLFMGGADIVLGFRRLSLYCFSFFFFCEKEGGEFRTCFPPLLSLA